MYKNVLQQIDNVQVWPIISFVIFFLFFLFLLWYVFTADKSFIRYMKEMPLNENNDPQSVTEKTSKS
ncbi:MAG: cbb3-type cytochrome c oxidase subunit 3 [Flammeovirgaceae bacterium]|nr:MAG: cbb3-type cytochrome c oxidase subunit 3 [Flammeovirgaceae bacterium]